MIHIPVLLKEVIEAIKVVPGGQYIDCTLGGGGHSAAILEQGGQVLGIDIDPQAIELARERLHPLWQECYLNQRKLRKPGGDLRQNGVSLHQRGAI